MRHDLTRSQFGRLSLYQCIWGVLTFHPLKCRSFCVCHSRIVFNVWFWLIFSAIYAQINSDIVMTQTDKTGYCNFRSHTSSASRGYSITFSLLPYPFTKQEDKFYALLYSWERLRFSKCLIYKIATLHQNFDQVACLSITPTKPF